MDKEDLKWLVSVLVNATAILIAALLTRKHGPPNKEPSPRKKHGRRRKHRR